MIPQNKGRKIKISHNVLFMGLVSFFNDWASEMIYPIVPLFLTTTLKAPTTIVGFIEGLAESFSSLLKVVFGWLSDKLGQRKPFVVLGYTASTFSKLILGLAQSWPLVLLGRAIDRLGKGLRTSPRDALIAESSSKDNRGLSFGFHRALDTLGAVLGPLTAVLLLNLLGPNFRLIFFLAFLPGLLGLIILFLFVQEEKRNHSFAFQDLGFQFRNIHPHFKIFLLVSIIFALGNSSDAFLILRAQNLGLPAFLVVLAYAFFNFTYAFLATPAGLLSDKIGPRRILLAGFFLFSFTYFLFGIVNKAILVWPLFFLYGLYMALTEGVSKAYIASLVPSRIVGSAFGLFQTIVGLCLFFASLLAGYLWAKISPHTPFLLGSFLALLAGLLFWVLEGRLVKNSKG